MGLPGEVRWASDVCVAPVLLPEGVEPGARAQQRRCGARLAPRQRCGIARVLCTVSARCLRWAAVSGCQFCIPRASASHRHSVAALPRCCVWGGLGCCVSALYLSSWPQGCSTTSQGAGIGDGQLQKYDFPLLQRSHTLLTHQVDYKKAVVQDQQGRLERFCQEESKDH